MTKKGILALFSTTITILGIMYFIINSNLEDKRQNNLQHKIISYSVDELIKQNDIDALSILAKEGNLKAKLHLKIIEDENNRLKAEQMFETASLMIKNGKIQEDTLTLLEISADLGNQQAALLLANLSFFGTVKNQDFSTAKKQYENLVKIDNPHKIESHQMLAWIYFNGLGTDRDIEKAKEHLKMISLGNNFLAVYNFQLLSDMGNKDAENLLKEFNLPINSKNKTETPNKFYLQKEWSEKEAKNNNPIALYNLAIISAAEGKYDESIAYAEKAIQNKLPLKEKRSLLSRFRNYAKLNKNSINFSIKLSQDILNQEQK